MAKKTDLSKTWSNMTFILASNIGNLCGKIFGGKRGNINKYTAYYVIIFRLYFFYTIPFMDTNLSQNDILLNNNIFPYINQYFFSFTSGLLLSNYYLLFRYMFYNELLAFSFEI